MFELSEEEKLDKMLETSALGDRKPSDLMAELIELCPPPPQADATTFVKRIFMRSLPTEARSVLSQHANLTPMMLGEAADKAWTSLCRSSAVPLKVNAASTTKFCKWHKRWGDKAR